MLPFELTKDTPYLALSGELWSVLYEYFNRNWPCYKGFLLYSENNYISHCIALHLKCVARDFLPIVSNSGNLCCHVWDIQEYSRLLLWLSNPFVPISDMQDPNLHVFINVPADVIGHYGSRPSACTTPTTNFNQENRTFIIQSFLQYAGWAKFC